ncbi:TIGR01621 family pseudouridine synthase [Uruburuella testudinis]|uniref:TIGR01621 family pseudouridine synthase n=1 Tax=Uruburuella testudinis TaxID=1282863 RepID=A0ABY4DSH1_9NEIS|nr:TIGR01621 family pseudouridine synthase [Uruburuella testudinis]UOO81980.1 TIGR01621 family pseudouridine synthase [Uruburuella testudinis]
MKLEILQHHDDFVAVYKPAGLAVHQQAEAAGLTQVLARQLGVARLWLVHRLDKPTSGVLLLALNQAAASALAQQFAAKTMRKTYLALSDGRPAKKQGWVKGDMHKARRGAWKLARSMENPAITRFYSQSTAPGLRLFVLQPFGGKTHQLRVAMKSLGSPILGDTLYCGTPAARLFLHAWKLEFSHGGRDFCICAEPDGDWPDRISDGLKSMPPF